MPTAALAASRELEAPRADGYVRHRPQESLLYQVVEEHWPDFSQRAEEAGGLPRFVVREFESFLKCGVLEHGLARLACRRCGHEMVIGFSDRRSVSRRSRAVKLTLSRPSGQTHARQVLAVDQDAPERSQERGRSQ